MNILDDFAKEIECTYKGETYSVRDNGSVMRHPRIDKKPRPTDNKWTFGKYNDKTGYAEIAGERVHRIVATAFNGKAPSPQHVVDHIDTNRRNNRPENLRWVTKLENILLNPITAKKVEFLCGSIEEFLKDPSKLRESASESNFAWMRAVSKEEATASLERLQNWSKNDKPSSGGSLGEWIYSRSTYSKPIKQSEKNMPTVDIVPPEPTENIDKPQVIITEEKQRIKSAQNKNSHPQDLPQSDVLDSDDTGNIYRTNGEIFRLLKELLEVDKKIKLPDIVLPTASKWIVVKDAWVEEFETVRYNYEGKSRIAKSVVLCCNDQQTALLIRATSKKDESEVNKLRDNNYNIVELDLSRNQGFTKTQMRYVLENSTTKKKWIHHALVTEAREKLKNISEPIICTGGFLHSYFACPVESQSVQDIDCWYCKYHIDIDIEEDGKKVKYEHCFGKSGVQTYQDLLSVVDVQREGQQITSITYNENGEKITRTFDAEVQLPGKTIFQLWDKTSNKLIAHNIYSGWYALIEENPNVCFERTGQVYGRINRSVKLLKSSRIREIFNPNDYSWEAVEYEIK